MKTKKTYIYVLAALLSAGSYACKSETNTTTTESNYSAGTDGGLDAYNHVLFDADGTPNPNGTVIGNGNQNFVFKGNRSLPQGVYLLKGWIYVANGSTLTLAPGTIIKGDRDTKATIIVEPGGKLIAEGTPKAPIVFTSAQPKGQRKPGDWGGIVICGNAPVNQQKPQIEGGPRTTYGGTLADDNSGVLSYVRIEFAGYPFQKDKEINGLTLAGVGSGTRLDHIQVSYSNDDSFEFFGGTARATHLIAYKGWDDDFDTDFGFSGSVQFGLSVRDPRIADASQSNSFESDNTADGAQVTPQTSAVFSNMTLVGPVGRENFVNSTDYITGGAYNPNNGASLGKFQAAFHIRRSSQLNCFNSLAIGFPIGLILDGEKGNTQQAAKEGKLKFQHVWFADMTLTGSDANKLYDDHLVTDYTSKPLGVDASQSSFSTSFFTAQPGNGLKTKSDLKLADYRSTGMMLMPQTGSPLLTAASFDDARLKGMTAVSYIGAFAQDDKWLDEWTNFDPNNADY